MLPILDGPEARAAELRRQLRQASVLLATVRSPLQAQMPLLRQAHQRIRAALAGLDELLDDAERLTAAPPPANIGAPR